MSIFKTKLSSLARLIFYWSLNLPHHWTCNPFCQMSASLSQAFTSLSIQMNTQVSPSSWDFFIPFYSLLTSPFFCIPEVFTMYFLGFFDLNKSNLFQGNFLKSKFSSWLIEVLKKIRTITYTFINFFFLATLCGMRHLSSLTRGWTCASCSGSKKSFNHWIAKEVPLATSKSHQAPEEDAVNRETT